jgi:hypothetical protein
MNHIAMINNERKNNNNLSTSNLMKTTMIAFLGAMVALTGCVAADGTGADELSAEAPQAEVESTAEAEQALESTPLYAEQLTHINDSGSRTMNTQATLQRGGDYAGQLYARTVTKNTVLASGFTGGVFIVFRNDDGAVVGVSGLHTYGVDGKWVGTYVRDEVWIENFDPQVAAATTQMEIVQQWASTDRIPEILSRIAAYKQQACAIYPVPGC